MSVDTDIQMQDFRAFVAFVARPSSVLRRSVELLLACTSYASLILLLGYLFDSSFDGGSMLVTYAATVITFVLYILYRQRKMFPNDRGLILGRKRVTVSLDGVGLTGENHESIFRWPLVRYVAETRKHIFIMLDRNAGVIIPRSSFPNSAECASFLAELRRHSSDK